MSSKEDTELKVQCMHAAAVVSAARSGENRYVTPDALIEYAEKLAYWASGKQQEDQDKRKADQEAAAKQAQHQEQQAQQAASKGKAA